MNMCNEMNDKDMWNKVQKVNVSLQLSRTLFHVMMTVNWAMSCHFQIPMIQC